MNRFIRSFTFWKQKALEQILDNQDLLMKQNILLMKQNKEKLIQLKNGDYILLKNITAITCFTSTFERVHKIYIERNFSNYITINFEKLDEAIKYKDELAEKVRLQNYE